MEPEVKVGDYVKVTYPGCAQLWATVEELLGTHLKVRGHYGEAHYPRWEYCEVWHDGTVGELTTSPAKTSDGGSTDYYKLPDGAKDLQDLIEHKDMGFALGNIFKACYRFGEKDVASKEYDINKIIFFAERLRGMLKRGKV